MLTMVLVDRNNNTEVKTLKHLLKVNQRTNIQRWSVRMTLPKVTYRVGRFLSVNLTALHEKADRWQRQLQLVCNCGWVPWSKCCFWLSWLIQKAFILAATWLLFHAKQNKSPHPTVLWSALVAPFDITTLLVVAMCLVINEATGKDVDRCTKWTQMRIRSKPLKPMNEYQRISEEGIE